MYVRDLGHRCKDGGVQRPPGLPSGPACLACGACLGLSTDYLGLSTACPGLQGARGRQLDVKWTPSVRQVSAKLACSPGLLGLPGPQYCLPGPQYCLSWPAGRQLDANWAAVGRQVDANWTPSWTAKTAASADICLKNAKTAAKSSRMPWQQYVCRCIATGAR